MTAQRQTVGRDPHRVRARGASLLLCALLWVDSALAASRDEQLARGDVLVTTIKVPQRAERMAHMEAVIDASPERVWAILSDCANFKHTMPKVIESEVLERDGNVVICRSTIDLAAPLPNLVSVTRTVYDVGDGHWNSDWSLVSGDYHYNEGRWRLTRYRDDPERTFAVYEALAAPKIAVPAALKRMAVTRSLPAIIVGVRRQLGVGPS